MPDKQVTIVIVAYQRYDNLPIIIHSFLCQTLQNFKLLVIHDGPDARMQALLQGFKSRYADVLDFLITPVRYNDFGHSLREIGIGLVDTPYLLLTNDDNYYAPPFLQFMFAARSLPSTFLRWNPSLVRPSSMAIAAILRCARWWWRRWAARSTL